MNMKKLLAGVVGATMLMSNVAFADAISTTTTTTYDAESKTYTVSTQVAGVASGSMVTYVLYRDVATENAPFDSTDGSLNGTASTLAPDQNNIVYIDQDNDSDGTSSFTAPGLLVGEAYGSRIIVGTDDSTATGSPWTEDVGDMYTVNWDSTNSDGIETITLIVTLGDVSVPYTLSEVSGPVYVPCLASCEATINIPAGKDIDKVYLNGVEVDAESTLQLTGTKDQPVTIGAKVVDAVAYTIVTLSDAIVDAEAKSVTYLVSVANGDANKTGLNVTINGNVFNNLIPVQTTDDVRYAIRIVDETEESSLGINLGTQSTAVPFLVTTEGNVVLEKDAERSNHYVVEDISGDELEKVKVEYNYDEN